MCVRVKVGLCDLVHLLTTKYVCVCVCVCVCVFVWFILVLSHWGSDTAVKVSRIQKTEGERAGRRHGAQQNNGVRRSERRRHRTVWTLEERSPHTPHTHTHTHTIQSKRMGHTLAEFTPDSWRPKPTPRPHSIELSVFVGETHKSRHMLTHGWHRLLSSSLAITFITTFIIIYMTICVGLRSEARGWQGWALKGSGACWDCGLLREWHSGRRCPAGRASGGCCMVNRPFMAGPQSLLSRANSSCPAWRDGEGGRGVVEGFIIFFLGVGSPHFFFPSSLFALQCGAGGGGALVWGSHMQTAACLVATTPQHWQKLQSAGKLQHNTGTHSRLMTPRKHLEAGTSCWVRC